jgi:hypothetical protein
MAAAAARRSLTPPPRLPRHRPPRAQKQYKALMQQQPGSTEAVEAQRHAATCLNNLKERLAPNGPSAAQRAQQELGL